MNVKKKRIKGKERKGKKRKGNAAIVKSINTKVRKKRKREKVFLSKGVIPDSLQPSPFRGSYFRRAAAEEGTGVGVALGDHQGCRTNSCLVESFVYSTKCNF